MTGVETVATSGLLSCRRLSVHYGGVQAVNNVDLDVEDGAIHGLIGPNGAGKTSLIDALSGFTAAVGDVFFRGQPLSGSKPYVRSRLGMSRTFQSLELFDDLSVEDNVVLGKRRQSSWDVAREVAMGRPKRLSDEDEALLDLFDLGPHRRTRVFELSHGHRKMVMLARALAGKPQLLLLDEPAAGLDNRESEELGAKLMEINNRGVTMLMVEHDMSLIMRLCRKITVLDFGRVICEGDAAKVQSDPQVVKAYLGAPTAEGQPV